MELGPNIPTESDTSNRDLDAMVDGVSTSMKFITHSATDEEDGIYMHSGIIQYT